MTGLPFLIHKLLFEKKQQKNLANFQIENTDECLTWKLLHQNLRRQKTLSLQFYELVSMSSYILAITLRALARLSCSFHTLLYVLTIDETQPAFSMVVPTQQHFVLMCDLRFLFLQKKENQKKLKNFHTIISHLPTCPTARIDECLWPVLLFICCAHQVVARHGGAE